MISIPSVSRRTLQKTRKPIVQNLAQFSVLEKYSIGQSTLFLDEAGVLNATEMKKSVDMLDREMVNQHIKKGCDQIISSYQEKLVSPDYSLPLYVSLGVEMDDFPLPTMTAHLEAHPYAYDVHGLSKLNEADQEVIASSIGEIRSFFINFMLPSDCLEYAGWWSETLDELDSIILAADIPLTRDSIEKFVDQNPDVMNTIDADFFEDKEHIIASYLGYKTELPAWFRLMEDGISSKNPKAAIRSLKEKLGTLYDSRAKQFLSECINSMEEYFRHFKTNKAWKEYKRWFFDDCFGTDEGACLEAAFVLVNSTEGFWWEVAEAFGQGFLEVGETPSCWASVANGEERRYFLIHCEGISRGVALIERVGELFNVE
jgi:hypothetical protein